MAPAKPITSKEVIQATIPDLNIGVFHTTSNAIHRMDHVAGLSPWENFEVLARANTIATPWVEHRSVVAHEPRGLMRHHISREQIVVGDETGVQGRFAQYIGQILTAACGAFGLDFIYGDYKGSSDVSIDGVPDAVFMDSQGVLHVVGEMKAEWVSAHNLEEFADLPDHQRRRLIGQISSYMRQRKIRYGFFSTYRWTLFLRQVEKDGEDWALEYSPSICNSARGGDEGITLREGFWYLLQLAAANHVANNNMPMASWVQ